MKVTLLDADAFTRGKRKVVGVCELARVPAKGEYLIIKGRRVMVECVQFHDNGDVDVVIS